MLETTVVGARMASKRKRPVDLEQRAQPTPERVRQADGAIEIGDDRRGSKTLTMRDAPLERALSRGVISRSQYDAGVKFRLHWYRGGMAGNLKTIDLNGVFGGQGSETEAKLFHRQQFFHARNSIGNWGAYVLDHVVCLETPLEKVGYSLGWGSKPQAIAVATEHLKIALDGLCRLWGIGR